MGTEDTIERANRLKALPSLQGRKTRFDDYKARCEVVAAERGCFLSEAFDIVSREPEYAPLADAQPEDKGPSPAKTVHTPLMVDEKPAEQQFNPSRDIVWVYENAMVRNPEANVGEPGGPPSTGALLLLSVAQRDNFFFVQHVLGPLFKSAALKDLASSLHDDGRKQVDLANSLMAAYDVPVNGTAVEL